MRVGIIALLQESNTFLPERTSLRHFEDEVLVTGEAVRGRFRGSHHEVGGFFAGLEEAQVDAVPIFAARALPYGEITSAAWQQLMQLMFDALKEAGECDGILAAVHGATVSEDELDADGYWLERLREYLGPAIPIIGTLDPHANLSPRMVKACNALIAYRTNPHVDQFACGHNAASLMVRTLRNEVRPTQAAVLTPVVINIEQQNTSTPPCRQLFEHADRMLARKDTLSNSVLLGFPYADVAEMGASTLVVTDNTPALAQEIATEMAELLWANRQQFLPKLVSIEDAITMASELQGPVCLLDMGDNVGGGGPGDSTWLAHVLHERNIHRSLVCLCDPSGVKRCEEVGTGGALRIAVGGCSGPLHGEPLEAQFTILGLYDGRFRESEPRHGGYSSFDQGRTAVIRTDGDLTVLLTSRRMAPFSLAQITSCELNPPSFKLVVAKGVIAPIAAYRSVCAHFIRVNTPGVTTADLSLLSYRRRRVPLYPFEMDFDWHAGQGDLK
jgi:microcystin degradation protein MlrC